MSWLQPAWHLIYTRPRHEKKVYDKLEEMNIDSFLPLKRTLRTWRDRKKYIDSPLFPSYVFVYLKDNRDYCNSMDIDGVVCYVRVGKSPAHVKETVVNNIKMLIHCSADLEVSSDYLEEGQEMVISQGPLTGLSCEIVKYNGKPNILVRIALLKRNVLLSLPRQHLMLPAI